MRGFNRMTPPGVQRFAPAYAAVQAPAHRRR